MSSKRAFVVVVASLALGTAFIACSSNDDRPAAASSGGTAIGSSGGGSTSASSSGSSSGDGSAPIDGSGSGSSSGSNDSGNDTGTGVIDTGYRASVDGIAAVYDVTPKAVRQSSGNIIEISGKEFGGSELKLTLTNTGGMADPGSYDCTGQVGAKYGAISYTTTGGTETWSGLANGECTITLISIDNQFNGIAVGTFSATVKRGGSADKIITNGEFRLALD